MSESQINRKNKLEVTKLELEVERLEEEVVKNESIITNSECEIKKLIGKYDDPIERQKLIEKWTLETKAEENKSDEIWTKKKEFFEKDEKFEFNQRLPPNKHTKQFHNNHEKTNRFPRNYHTNNNHDNFHTSRNKYNNCLLYTSPSPRDKRQSRMPSSA